MTWEWIVFSIVTVCFFIYFREINRRLDAIEEKTIQGLSILISEKRQLENKENAIDISLKLSRIEEQNKSIINRISDVERGVNLVIKNASTPKYMGSIESEINRIHLAVVSLPHKVDMTYTKLNEVLDIWRKILMTKKK